MIMYIIQGAAIGILLFLVLKYRKQALQRIEINSEIETANYNLAEEHAWLEGQVEELDAVYQKKVEENQEKERELNDIKYHISTQNNVLQSISLSVENAKKAADAQEETLRQARVAAENQLKEIRESQTQALKEDFEIRKKQQDKELEQRLTELQSTIDERRKKLEKEFSDRSETIVRKLADEQSKLEELQAKQLAYIQAKQREEEMEKQRDYYRLILDDSSLNDVQLLRDIQRTFAHRDVIDKLIWEVFYKPAYDILMSHLFPNSGKVCGIYKITNIDSGLAYIGQSVDVKERFRQHVKASLAASGQTNKLYQEMKKHGPENFTFEVLEIVDRAKLNEREAYWIEFYKTKEFGMNGTRGNNT